MTDQPTDPIASHLEFLGYESRTTPDGWCFAEHPKRLNFFFKRFPHGWRFHAVIYLGPSLGELRTSFLDAVNAINERSVVVKFTLNRDPDGDYCVNARTVFQSEYVKKPFGLFMDIWHSDLELLSELPTVPKADEEGEESTGEEARTVN